MTIFCPAQNISDLIFKLCSQADWLNKSTDAFEIPKAISSHRSPSRAFLCWSSPRFPAICSRFEGISRTHLGVAVPGRVGWVCLVAGPWLDCFESKIGKIFMSIEFPLSRSADDCSMWSSTKNGNFPFYFCVCALTINLNAFVTRRIQFSQEKPKNSLLDLRKRIGRVFYGTKVCFQKNRNSAWTSNSPTVGIENRSLFLSSSLVSIMRCLQLVVLKLRCLHWKFANNFLFANALRRLTNCAHGINRQRSIIRGVYRVGCLLLIFTEVHNNLRNRDASLVGHFLAETSART